MEEMRIGVSMLKPKLLGSLFPEVVLLLENRNVLILYFLVRDDGGFI